MTSNRERARANEMAVLTAVGEMGWLSTSQAARWVWSESTMHVATNKASAVLRRLTEQGYLLCRQNALGVRVFILTTSGAIRANGDRGPAYRAGYKLSQLDCYRQQLVFDFLVSMRSRGFVCTGPAGLRRALSTGALLDTELRGADALVCDAEQGTLLPVLVVRSLNVGVIKKAIRLEDVAGGLQLLGQVGLLAQFRRQMIQERNAAQ